MAESKHTPGPWAARTGTVYSENVVVASAFATSAGPIGIAEGNANARLIAAAPELLAALILAESFMAGFEDDELQDGINDRLATVRAALAKAGAA